ncbi:hypothetical protein [Nostoc sp.]
MDAAQASPLHNNWLEIKQKTHSTSGLNTDLSQVMTRHQLAKEIIPKRSPLFI